MISLNSKKSKKTTAIDSNKENINPNILHNFGDKSNSSSRSFIDFHHKHTPKVSTFQVFNENKDWQKKILQPSEREKKLQQRLSKMAFHEQSPHKQSARFTTDFNSNTSLSTTLWKYLCEKSLIQNEIIDRSSCEIFDDLVTICEEITGQKIEREKFQNNQDLIEGITTSLRKFKQQNS